MTVVSIIGAGHIGSNVIEIIASGVLPGFELGAVLVRDPSKRTSDGLNYTDDWDAFVASAPDLIIELAGPAAFKSYAVKTIAIAETWSISSAALADPELDAAIACSLSNGGKLRFLAGAIGGLDAVAAATVDPASQISVTVALANTPPNAEPDFIGSARDVVRRFHGVNVVAAIALAGHGLDRTSVRYFDRPNGEQRSFVVDVSSRHGAYRFECKPTPVPGPSAVVASVVSALRSRSRNLVVG